MITQLPPMLPGGMGQAPAIAPPRRSPLVEALMSSPGIPTSAPNYGAAMPSPQAMAQAAQYLRAPADKAPPTDAMGKPLVGANGMLTGGQMQSYNPGYSNGDALWDRITGLFGGGNGG